jgi:hypothetical protein
MPQAARRRDRGRRTVAFAIRCFAAALFVASLAPAGAASAHHACDFYRQLERRCGCAGAENYFGSYGARHCERFMHAAGWSAAGLRWRDRTLACLKSELTRFVANTRGCGCAQVKAFAFASHARCYTAQPASACRLPLSDIRRIYGLVDAADLFDPLGMGQTLAITFACVRQNGDAGARPDSPVP